MTKLEKYSKKRSDPDFCDRQRRSAGIGHSSKLIVLYDDQGNKWEPFFILPNALSALTNERFSSSSTNIKISIVI